MAKDDQEPSWIRKTVRGAEFLAFGEWKSVYGWADDPRCRISKSALAVRLAKGEPPEVALARVSTPSERTRAQARSFEAFGESKTLVQWSEDPRCEVHYHTLRKLVNSGVPLVKALSKQPVVKPNKRKKVSAFGETRSITDWNSDERCTVSHGLLQQRLSTGMQAEDAISRRRRYTNPTYEAFGECKLLMDWARDPRCIVSFQSLFKRVQAGMPIEKAMTTPMVRNVPKHRVWAPITAFDETKSIMEWSKDARCVVSEMTLRKRIKAGIAPEEAICTFPGSGLHGFWAHQVKLDRLAEEIAAAALDDRSEDLTRAESE